jgi:hypothetical protein
MAVICCDSQRHIVGRWSAPRLTDLKKGHWHRRHGDSSRTSAGCPCSCALPSNARVMNISLGADKRPCLGFFFDTPTRRAGRPRKHKKGGIPNPLQRITACSQSIGARRAFAA